MTKELGPAAVKGKDIDHIKPLRQGGSNSRSNLRVTSIKKNRGRKT
jgi:5-methylcytosine-specific restriction endonuclease McrA